MIDKLKRGDDLSKEEIEQLLYDYPTVHEVEGDDNRWTRDVTTVVEVDGVLYAVDWKRALTENQTSNYPYEPYRVELKVKTVCMDVTEIIEITVNDID